MLLFYGRGAKLLQLLWSNFFLSLCPTGAIHFDRNNEKANRFEQFKNVGGKNLRNFLILLNKFDSLFKLLQYFQHIVKLSTNCFIRTKYRTYL